MPKSLLVRSLSLDSAHYSERFSLYTAIAFTAIFYVIFAIQRKQRRFVHIKLHVSDIMSKSV